VTCSDCACSQRTILARQRSASIDRLSSPDLGNVDLHELAGSSQISREFGRRSVIRDETVILPALDCGCVGEVGQGTGAESQPDGMIVMTGDVIKDKTIAERKNVDDRMGRAFAADLDVCDSAGHSAPLVIVQEANRDGPHAV
jgi:hypothetical protein